MKVRLPLLIAGVLTAGFLLAVAFDTPREVRGPAPYPPEWQWGLRDGPTSGRFGPVVLAGAGLVALLGVSGSAGARRRPRLAARLLIAVGIPLGTGFSLSLLGLEPGGAFANVAARVMSRTYTSYYTVAVSAEAHDPRAFLDRHASLLPTFRESAKHAATHPPGPVLYYRGLIALCERTPLMTAALLDLQGHDPSRPPRPPNTPASKAAALLGGLLLMLLGAAAAWPIASLSGGLAGDPLAGARAGLLWLLLPGPVLMVPQFDQALALPIAGVAALLAAAVAGAAGPGHRLAGFTPASASAAVGAGLAAGVALFLSYGCAAFLAISGLAALAPAASDPKRRRPAVSVSVLAAVVAAGVIGLTVLLGHEPIAAARTALAIHRETYTAVRSYALWLLFNPLDLAIFLGLPVAVLAVLRMADALRSGSSEGDRFTAGLALGLVVLGLSGSTRGEVGRIWIPVMPLLLIAALTRSVDDGDSGPPRAEILTLGLLLAVSCAVLRVCWDL
jgi:hypothetical protein